MHPAGVVFKGSIGACPGAVLSILGMVTIRSWRSARPLRLRQALIVAATIEVVLGRDRPTRPQRALSERPPAASSALSAPSACTPGSTDQVAGPTGHRSGRTGRRVSDRIPATAAELSPNRAMTSQDPGGRESPDRQFAQPLARRARLGRSPRPFHQAATPPPTPQLGLDLHGHRRLLWGSSPVSSFWIDRQGVRSQEVFVLDTWATPFLHGVASPASMPS